MKHVLFAVLVVLMLATGLFGTGLADTSFAPVLAPTSTYYVANTAGECGSYSDCYYGPTALQQHIAELINTSGTITVIGHYQSNSDVIIDTQDITLRPLNGSVSLSQTGSCISAGCSTSLLSAITPLVI